MFRNFLVHNTRRNATSYFFLLSIYTSFNLQDEVVVVRVGRLHISFDLWYIFLVHAQYI